MRHRNSLVALFVGIIFLGGCATKVDLYKYKDVSSTQIVDDSKANYKVVKPKLQRNIVVENYSDPSFTGTISDYFLAANNMKGIFTVMESEGYRIRLSLKNLGHTRIYHPSVLVTNKEKSYYTRPYVSYNVSCSATAELNAPDGKKSYFEASYGYSFSSDPNNIWGGVSRERYLEALQETLDKLLRQIGNEVAPEALIVSKKVAIDDNKDYIFMINMGSQEGIRPEQKVSLYKDVIFKNEIDGETLNNKVLIGTATVSDQVMAHYAWIVLDDDDHNTLIEVGDIVRPQY